LHAANVRRDDATVKKDLFRAVIGIPSALKAAAKCVEEKAKYGWLFFNIGR